MHLHYRGRGTSIPASSRPEYTHSGSSISIKNGACSGGLLGKSSTTVLVCICLTLLLAGCSNNPGIRTASLNLANQLYESFDRDHHEAPVRDITIQQQRLYLDASISMAGYVRDSNGHSTFDEVLDRMPYIMPNCVVYRYGQRGRVPPANVADLFTPTQFGHKLHNPDFYTLQDNPDDRLVNMLSSEKQPAFSVLITDGVYSATAGNGSSVVVDAMSRWMQKGYDLGILIFRSPYHGPFYSEQARRMISSVSVSNRPFYAFVFSPSAQAFTVLRDRLAKEFPKMETIFFSNQGLELRVQLPMQEESLYAFLQPPNSPYHWQMFKSSLFGSQEMATLTYKLIYTIGPYYPAAQLDIGIDPRYYHWVGSGPFEEVEGSGRPDFSYPVGIVCTSGAAPLSSAEECSCDIPFKLGRDPKAADSFYAFRLNASVLALRPDIRKLSTMDDSLVQNSDRTYRFYSLISALVGEHLKIQLAHEDSAWIFVTVGADR